MSKPKICEILSVDVSEVFGIEGYSGEEFYINAEGDFCSTKCQNKVHRWYALMDVLNEKKKIILQMRWTQQDVEDAKAMKKYFPTFDRVRRAVLEQPGGGSNEVLYLMDGKGNAKYIGNLEAFPSLAIDKIVELREIINAEVQ